MPPRAWGKATWHKARLLVRIFWSSPWEWGGKWVPTNPTAVPRSPQRSHCFRSIALKDSQEFCRTQFPPLPGWELFSPLDTGRDVVFPAPAVTCPLSRCPRLSPTT